MWTILNEDLVKMGKPQYQIIAKIVFSVSDCMLVADRKVGTTFEVSLRYWRLESRVEFQEEPEQRSETNVGVSMKPERRKAKETNSTPSLERLNSNRIEALKELVSKFGGPKELLKSAYFMDSLGSNESFVWPVLEWNEGASGMFAGREKRLRDWMSDSVEQNRAKWPTDLKGAISIQFDGTAGVESEVQKEAQLDDSLIGCGYPSAGTSAWRVEGAKQGETEGGHSPKRIIRKDGWFKHNIYSRGPKLKVGYAMSTLHEKVAEHWLEPVLESNKGARSGIQGCRPGEIPDFIGCNRPSVVNGLTRRSLLYLVSGTGRTSEYVDMYSPKRDKRIEKRIELRPAFESNDGGVDRRAGAGDDTKMHAHARNKPISAGASQYVPPKREFFTLNMAMAGSRVERGSSQDVGLPDRRVVSNSARESVNFIRQPAAGHGYGYLRSLNPPAAHKSTAGSTGHGSPADPPPDRYPSSRVRVSAGTGTGRLANTRGRPVTITSLNTRPAVGSNEGARDMEGSWDNLRLAILEGLQRVRESSQSERTSSEEWLRVARNHLKGWVVQERSTPRKLESHVDSKRQSKRVVPVENYPHGRFSSRTRELAHDEVDARIGQEFVKVKPMSRPIPFLPHLISSTRYFTHSTFPPSPKKSPTGMPRRSTLHLRYPTPQLEISGLPSGESDIVLDADVPYYVAPPSQVLPQEHAPQAPQQVPPLVPSSETTRHHTRSHTRSFATSVSRLSTTSSSSLPSSALPSSSSAPSSSAASSSAPSSSSSPSPVALASPSASSSGNGPQTLSHGVPFDAAIALGTLIGVACICVTIAYFVRLRSTRNRAVDKIRWDPVVLDVDREPKEGEEQGQGGGLIPPPVHSVYSLTGDRDVGEPKRSESFIARRPSTAHSLASSDLPYQTPFGAPHPHRASVDPAHTNPEDNSNPFVDGYTHPPLAEITAYPLPPPAGAAPMFIPPMILPGPRTQSPLPLPPPGAMTSATPRGRPLPVHPCQRQSVVRQQSSRTGSIRSTSHSAATLGPLWVANAHDADEGYQEPYRTLEGGWGTLGAPESTPRNRNHDLPPAEQPQQQEGGWGQALRASVLGALQVVTGVRGGALSPVVEDDVDRLTRAPSMARERREAGWARFRGWDGSFSSSSAASSRMSDSGRLNVPDPAYYGIGKATDWGESTGALTISTLEGGNGVSIGGVSRCSEAPLIKRPPNVARESGGSVYSVKSVRQTHGRGRREAEGCVEEGREGYEYW
ncbi:hypothetical protein FB45DRAFT_1011212 [Roridomyces roridus]|uniref:Uncharacterized protein n=1 Tax=Roridomyces roridus TaxID=1738132 RepID=A0AAD7B255_9AGAR|nr:hypothetical protein FB45DRAFT_1011212 [Roridomyces roridus]